MMDAATKMVENFKPETLAARYGSDIAVWLQEHLQEMYADLEEESCVDNHRLCEEGTPEQLDFEQASEAGCCGCYERRHVHPSGRVFLVGCNYGH